MAHLDDFDASTVEPNLGFEAIPAGRYEAVISASEWRDTKAGDGSYLYLELTVLDGEYKGRKVFDRLNLKNANEQAVQIAKGTLSAICRAVNVLKPGDSIKLHNLPMVITVRCKRREDTGDLSNEIQKYEPRQTVQTAQAPVTSNAPWARGGK